MTQLDLENTALARAASLSPERPENSEEDSLEVDQIMEKIMQLRKQLKSALEKSDGPITLASEYGWFMTVSLEEFSFFKVMDDVGVGKKTKEQNKVNTWQQIFLCHSYFWSYTKVNTDCL